jgi:hypothetical protein
LRECIKLIKEMQGTKNRRGGGKNGHSCSVCTCLTASIALAAFGVPLCSASTQEALSEQERLVKEQEKLAKGIKALGDMPMRIAKKAEAAFKPPREKKHNSRPYFQTPMARRRMLTTSRSCCFLCFFSPVKDLQTIMHHFMSRAAEYGAELVYQNTGEHVKRA